MSQSMERPLTWRERVIVKVHSAICVWCEWYLQHLHFMRETLRKQRDKVVKGQASAISLSAEARERIKLALQHKK